MRLCCVMTVALTFLAQQSSAQDAPLQLAAAPKKTSPTVAAPPQGLSRISVGRDVVIGDPAAAYLGTAIWRRDGLLAWQNGLDSKIWYCQLNPLNGDMIPPDGRGKFVAKAAPYGGNALLRQLTGLGKMGTYNGPEWGLSQQGLGVYLTVVDNRGVYQQAKCLLKNAPRLIVEPFTSGGTNMRIDNLSTQNPNDPRARVGFFQLPPDFTSVGNNNQPYPTYWQFDEPGQPQHPIPLDTLSFNGPRWIPGEPSVLTFVKAPDQTLQVASFNTDTEQLTFLTSGPEFHLDAEIVVDPLSGRKYMTAIENNRAVAVYEQIAGSWQKTRTVYPPLDPLPDFYILFAVKPLLVRGQLVFYYKVYQGTLEGTPGSPIDIFVGTGNGAISAQITRGGPFSYHMNPQFYIGAQDNKVFLYYYTSIPIQPFQLMSQFRRISFTVE